MSWTVGRLSEELQLDLRGDPEHVIQSVGTLQNADTDQLAFLANQSYRSQLPKTQAGVVILAPRDADDCPTRCLIADNPYLAYARAATLFEERPDQPAGVHPTAVVSPSAQVHPSAHVAALCVVAPDAQRGAGTSIGPGSVVGAGATVGVGCRLVARVVLCEGVVLGSRVLIHPGAVIGADGFGIAPDEGQRWLKVPQLGSVRIGDDCEIGANTTIDRGAIEDTVLEDDVRIDNLVQVGHNVRIGAHSALAGSAAIAGSTTIGRRCLIGGGVGMVGHLNVADDVTITARTLVTHSIREAGVYSSGSPMEENSRWRRNAARMRQLDKLARQVAAMAKDKKEA